MPQLCHEYAIDATSSTSLALVGDLIQDPTTCSAAIPKWLDEGASDPDFYIHLDNDGTAYWLVQCLDNETGEQVIWRVTPDGAEPPEASDP